MEKEENCQNVSALTIVPRQSIDDCLNCSSSSQFSLLRPGKVYMQNAVSTIPLPEWAERDCTSDALLAK